MNVARYRQAEARLWNAVGCHPTEERIRLDGTGTEVRIQAVGEGEPVLFVHGGPNAGSTWAPMVAHLAGFRCLLVDRPGTGLSEPYPVRTRNLAEFGARFVPDVLDGLGLEQAHVVASSFGGHLALRSAAANPDRFAHMVQMAAPALVPGATYPPFMRLMTSRLVRRLLGALPPNERAARMIFRQLGHGASLEAGRIPQVFFDWYLDLQRYTDTMLHDGEMIGQVVQNRSSVLLTDRVLGSVATPTLFLWGADDGFGDVENARQVTGMMPHAELKMITAAGHLPWLDDPASVARDTRRFLSNAAAAHGVERSSA